MLDCEALNSGDLQLPTCALLAAHGSLIAVCVGAVSIRAVKAAVPAKKSGGLGTPVAGAWPRCQY